MSKKCWLVKGSQMFAFAGVLFAFAGCSREPLNCWDRCSGLPVTELLECLRQFC